MSVRIGVSGWSYRRWRGDFYPARLRLSAELGYVAARTSAVEVNASFYRLQRPETYATWLRDTPDGFPFALKGSRYITHLRSLLGSELPLANFFASGPLVLGDRLGPVLWQLPPALAFDRARISAFLSLLPRTSVQAAGMAAQHDDRVPPDRAFTRAVVDLPMRHVVEPRHPSFATPEALDLLREHGVGLVVADSAGRFPQLDAVTSDLVYVRLHGHSELYHGGYEGPLLSSWADRVRAWHDVTGDVWVFFDNDADGRAPYDARALAALLPDLVATASPSTTA